MLLSHKLIAMEALHHAPLSNFIKLKDLQMFETLILFQKNKLGELENGEINNRQQKLNLMMVDSKMPELIVDLAQGIFSYKYNGFKDFVDLNSFKTSQVIDIRTFMKRKISDLLEYLLFAKFNQDSAWNGSINNDNIYCLKNSKSELTFFTVYERGKLFDFVADHLFVSTSIMHDDSSHFLLEMKFQIKL